VDETGEIGTFIIISESSTAAGIRRIEAVTGREAQALINKRFEQLENAARMLEVSADQLEGKLVNILEKEKQLEKENHELQKKAAFIKYNEAKEDIEVVNGVNILALNLGNVDSTTLRELADRFRSEYREGTAVFSAINEKTEPYFIATVTANLVEKGIKAGDVVNAAAAVVGGRGGGRPDLAQAGGKDTSKIDEALSKAKAFIKAKLE
jgi:alanyl-tRNA synthetase